LAKSNDEKRGEVKMRFSEKILKFIIKENEKRMTLIELLAVIVILGIVSVIAIPSIGSLITSSERKAQAANAHMIINAARHYITSNTFKEDASGTNKEKIPVSKLIMDGFLSALPKDPYDNKTNYGTDSAVTVKQSSVGIGVDLAESYVYSIQLINSDNTKNRVSSAATGGTPVDEDVVDTSVIIK
jgi:type IV pilus assembly protein PilA